MQKACAIATDYLGSSGDPAPRLEQIAAAGFTHLHWCHQWNTDHRYTNAEIAAIARTLHRTGLKLLDIHGSDGGANGCLQCWYATDELCRREGVELVLNRLQMHAMLRGEGTLMMHVPYMRTAWNPEQARHAHDLLNALRRSLDELVPTCQALGIALALENMPGDTGEFLEMLFAEYPADAVGLCYDSGHGNISFPGEPARGLELLARNKDRLRALHLHDNDGAGDQHQPPGFGNIDWKKLTKLIFSSASYRGPLSFELHCAAPSAPEGTTPEQWLADTLRRCHALDPR